MTVIPASGSGDIVGTASGVVSSTTQEAVLVLGAGHDMTGILDIQAPLVNNGRIIADNSGEVITLSTYAKTGNGDYEISTHATAEIMVNVPVSGSSGSGLTISNGTLTVNYFFILCGELNMTGGAIDGDSVVYACTVLHEGTGNGGTITVASGARLTTLCE